MKKCSTIPNAVKAEFTQAISDWVKSLPEAEAEKPSVYVSGVGYSPVQILAAVEHETDFGIEFLAGLDAINRRMRSTEVKLSIVGLIRQGI